MSHSELKLNEDMLLEIIEICGELQVELARVNVPGQSDYERIYEISRHYYNLGATLKNAGLENIKADMGILSVFTDTENPGL